MLRRPLLSLALSTCVGIGIVGGISVGVSPAGATSDTTTTTVNSPQVTTDSPATDTPVTDSTSLTNFLTDIQNDPGLCIGFNPPPNCGRKPTQAGDRGGPLQYAVFGVMMAGLAIIGTVIARKIMARDKLIAESIAAEESQRD